MTKQEFQEMVKIPKKEYDELKLKKDLFDLTQLKGSVKREITEEEYERNREEAAQEICKKFK